MNSITEKLDQQQINGEEKLEGAGRNQIMELAGHSSSNSSMSTSIASSPE